MNIDKGSFLILVGTMAASGAGGWFARDKLVLRSEPQAAPAPTPESPPPPKSAEPPPAPVPPAAPPCDDGVGEVPECTGFPDPGDEGGCNLAAPRCLQYRESFKPKVARAAIECLKRLKGAQLCDPVIINKCGHEALMAACPGDTAVEQSCTTLLTSCKTATPGPTPADCKQTLSGMNDTGRKKMATCLEKLCDARGLYGCEAR
jgi:hypothetical protein